MYLGRFLGVTLDTCQDTSGYVYLGLFITIHQDTPRYKITIHVHVSWTRHDEYMWDTCKVLCGIHAGYMYLQWFHRIHRGYMRDTSGIHHERHVSQMYAERYVSEVLVRCKIHARYMQDTCILIYPQR
jgi:hypothetical protein